jgi:DNA-directed RNA polymerase specialized sigma24 family protein
MSVELGGGSTRDDRLAKALRDAGQHVLAYLYESFAARLFDYCEGVLADEVAATDAVQDSLVAVNAKIGTLPDPDRLRVSLYSEAHRQCLTKLPRRGIRSQRSAAAAAAGEPVGPSAGAADTEAVTGGADARMTGTGGADTRTVATAALGRLSDRDREVLNLAFRHGIEGADLAAVLGVSGGRARAMLSGAGARFRKSAADVAALRRGVAGDQILGPEMLAAVPLAPPPLTLRLRMTRTALALGSYRRAGASRTATSADSVIPVRLGARRGLPHVVVVSSLGLVMLAVPGTLLYQLVGAATDRSPIAVQVAGIRSPASAGPSLMSSALDPGGSVRQQRQGPFPGVLGPPPLGVLPVPSPQQSGPAPTPTPPNTTSPGPVPSHSTTPPPTTPAPTPPPPSTPPPTTPPPSTPPPTTPPPTTPPPTTPPPTTPPPLPTPSP